MESLSTPQDRLSSADKDTNKSNTPQEYTYQLTQRPYGIGSQPEGQLRHVDDGSKFGSVVYDHPLSAEEVKNFSLTPITEAKALEGRTFEVPFGDEKDVYHVDKVDDDGTIHYHVNEEAPLQARYHDFLSELGDEAKEVKVNPKTGDEKIRYQKTNSTGHVSESEAAAREVATNLARKALGDDSVINDWDFGQRVLDEVNGKARKMAFGEPYDYEKYPRGRVEPNLAEKSVSVVAADANHGFTNYKEAKSWAKQNISKVYNNEETGGKGTVRISNAAIDKFLSQSAIDKSESKDVHMAVLKVLPEVLKTSLDVETHPDFLKGENGKRNAENGINKDVLVHRCYGAVSIEGKPYRVKITLKEDPRDLSFPHVTHSYEATKIELLEGTWENLEGPSPNTSNSITAAKLLNGVEMSYDSGKKLLDESKKRSETIREQRVFHGSGADFDHFDHSHMGEGEGAQVYGWGTYVTEVEGIGRTYAEISDYDPVARNLLSKKSNAVRFLKKYPTIESFLSDEKIRNNPRSEEEKISYYNEHVKNANYFSHHLYTVEIPDDNGHNYLDWVEPVHKEILDVIKSGLKDFLKPDVDDFREELKIPQKYSDDYILELEVANILQVYSKEKTDSGQNIYNRLKAYFGGQEEASRFLSNLGLVGIKYPADYRNGGREDGAKNYVIFNEKDAKITDHIRYFRTPNGEAYGFTLGGKIYIDPRVATAETPIHEYSHLWATAMQKNNPAEWENIVGLMKGTSVWDEVKKKYPELTDNSEIADEVLAHYSGRRGAERLREEMRKATEGNGSPLDKAKAVSALQRIKVALDKFWKGVADFLHIHYTTAEEVADRVMKDLLDGVDPRKFGVDSKVREQFIGERGAKEADHAEEVTTRLDNLGVAREMEAADKDAKAIKMATGWERGADGKWRYEIPEGKYYPKGDAEYEKVRDKQPWSKELDLLTDRIFDGEELSAEENERFEQLANEEAKFKAEYLTREKPYLADWLKNDALFKAYPDLKNVEIVFTDNLPEDTRGYYSERENKIVVNTKSDLDTESIIAHEVQHAIQHIEGFAKGGSPESVEKEFNKAKEEWAARAYAHALEETAKELGGDYNQSEVEKALIKEYEEMGMSDRLPSIETRIKGFNYFARGYADRSIDDAIKHFRLDKSPRADFDPNTEYRKLGGEVEARNVQTRMPMSPEERRQSLASETEDVSRDDQIFLFGEGGGYSANVSDNGIRYRTSEDLNKEYGSRWIDEQTNDDGRHTTQVKNTINSYKKFGDWVKRDAKGKSVSVLDASSGLGLGTEWMRENGIEVEDVEPYPSENRNAPTYTSYDDVKKKYDYIISNAVLNVIPDDWRANVLHNMADKLKKGGKLVINVRGAESIIKQGKEGETRITLDDPSEILVLRPNGSIKAYQKGFTKQELKEWCEKELGKYYSVEIANNKNAGGSYDTAVVVTKNNESNTIGVASEAGHPRRSAQSVLNSSAKVEHIFEYTKALEDVSASLSEEKMGAHQFLYNLAKAFGLKGDNLNKSFYQDLTNSVGIRIADHSANTLNIANKNTNENVYGIVIKLSNHHFKANEDANYLEYVYYPDKLSQERQQDIVNGLKSFLQSGDYAALPKPDKVNASGIFNNLYRLKDGTFIKSGSYFSGGGLLEEGLKRYLDPSIAVEFNEKISGVYADNFGNHIVTADVRDVDPRELAQKIDGEVQYFHASPVCKNYSRAKREGGEVELDKETAQSTADFISAKRPKVVTIENVKGYKNSEALKIITDELTKQGYDWDMDVYNTADYGGYTKRERLIVRAVRDGKLPEKPKPLPESERKQGWWEAVEDLIADLPEKKSGVADWMDTRLKGEGIDYRKIDKPLYVFGQGNNAHSVSHAFADELIPTLRTKGGDVIIMPDGRVLQATPRVLARLTGLGDDYKMPETDQLAHTIVGNGIPTQLSENVIGPLLDHAFNEGERASSESMITDRRNNDKRDTATRLTSAIHLDGSVEVLETSEGLEGRKRKAKGWYDPRTGKITVVLGNHESAADVQKTIFHEAVAHKGLRTIVGEENFDTFIDNVYRNAEEGIQAEVDRLAEEKYNGDKRVAMEEYMAKLAEDGEFAKPENRKLFDKVKDFIVDLLKKAGIDLGFKLTDNDIRYMLWRSYKNLTENVHRNAFEMAEDAKMREKFEQTPEAERRGEQRRRQETLFRDGNETIQKAVETMRERVSKAVDISKENKADTMRDIGGNLTNLRRAMSAQRAYDMTTVRAITDLTRDMIKNRIVRNISESETKKLLSIVNNVHGKGDIRPYVNKLMDLMVTNVMRNNNEYLGKLLALRRGKINASGVKTQGLLDAKGQKLAQYVWDNMSNEAADVEARMAEVQEKLTSKDKLIADDAAIEYEGLQIAKQYIDTIKESKKEEKRLLQEMNDFKEKIDAGEEKLGERTWKSYVDEVHETILQVKAERAEAYQALIDRLSGQLGESAKRAKQWQEENVQRVKDIYHNANSDQEGLTKYSLLFMCGV